MKIYLDNNVLVDIESGKYSGLLHTTHVPPKILTSLEFQAETCRILQFPPEIKLRTVTFYSFVITFLKSA